MGAMGVHNYGVAWITGEVGQPVAAYTSEWRGRAELTTIERVTKTLFITAAGRQYRRSTGERVGDKGYFAERLLPPDAPEVRKAQIVAAFYAARNGTEDAFKQGRNNDGDQYALVKALCVAREAIDDALATVGRLWVSERDDGQAEPVTGGPHGELPIDTALRAYHEFADEAGVGGGDPATNRKHALFIALATHEHQLRVMMASEVMQRTAPPRLGGMAYWHGLNDAARIVKREPLDDVDD